MATWSHRIVTSRRHEWTVPAREPWGAMLGDIQSAMAVADISWRTHHDWPKGGTIPADALKFRPSDEEIVIWYTTDEVIT